MRSWNICERGYRKSRLQLWDGSYVSVNFISNCYFHEWHISTIQNTVLLFTYIYIYYKNDVANNVICINMISGFWSCAPFQVSLYRHINMHGYGNPAGWMFDICVLCWHFQQWSRNQNVYWCMIDSQTQRQAAVFITVLLWLNHKKEQTVWNIFDTKLNSI